MESSVQALDWERTKCLGVTSVVGHGRAQRGVKRQEGSWKGVTGKGLTHLMPRHPS